MKLKTPKSLESWLFTVGAGFLVLMGLLWGIATIVVTDRHGRVPSPGNLGQGAAVSLFDVAIAILELAGLICVALSALVSIFRTLLPSKPK